MRLLLIRPNSPTEVIFPPVGLGYLSKAVKRNRGDETLIIDVKKLRLSDEGLINIVFDYGPDAIGITSMTYEASETARLTDLLKRDYPDIPVIIGGPHPTACGASTLDRIRADYVVIGEGEETLIELLDVIQGKRIISSVKGVAWRDGSNVIYNGPRPFIDDVDALEVDWEAIEPEKYFSIWRRNAQNTIAKSGRRLPVFASRGCPHDCIYCHHQFGRKYRGCDIDKTVTRMIEIRDRYRVEEFEILDDAFNVNLGRAKDFMKEIITRGLGCALSFSNSLRVDSMDEELLDLMIQAGTYRVGYSIESAIPRIQKLIRKNIDLDRARYIVNLTASKKIVTATYYMLGFPEETEDEMLQTVDYAVSLNNHIASFFYLNPFPGTEIAECNTLISEKVRDMDYSGFSGITFNLSNVPDRTLMKVRRSAYRRFYFSPRRLSRIIRDVPKNQMLLVSGYAALRLSFRENVDY